MYGQEASVIFEAFMDLNNSYSLDNVCAFLETCWLIPSNQVFETVTLERLIYAEGDSDEIFTGPERILIKQHNGEVYYTQVTLETIQKNVEGYFFAVEIKSTDCIYDSISIMKLINKAIKGFNVFLLAAPQGVFIGCSTLTRDNSYRDCILSPIINTKINWEMLSDALMYRTDSMKLTEYYEGIVGICEGIKYCYQATEDISYYKEIDRDFCSTEFHEDIRTLLLRTKLYQAADTEEDNAVFDVDEFEKEVDGCMFDLSYIQKSHINPLELLFEAEKALESNEQISYEDNVQSPIEQEGDMTNMKMINDPIALMKKLKKDRGL